ncbi:MAG: DNA-directed RNA polymerase subunit delta [Myxococcales bacterium]|nr:DNA-directed RNA polymerase subunit delta [Myxococcales bacterium]
MPGDASAATAFTTTSPKPAATPRWPLPGYRPPANRWRLLKPRRAPARAALALLFAAVAGAQAAGADEAPAVASSELSVPVAGIVALQSDFGLQDHAVAAMHGVILGVDRHLVVQDLTHGIAAYDVWQAAYRLRAVLAYWPRGSVLVSIVDPGVGTDRRSVIALTRTGHYVVTPDNGTLTLLAEQPGIVQLRSIDETTNRRPGAEHSNTFHGRDVYAFTAARLASGSISFAEVGPLVDRPVLLPYERAHRDGNAVVGTVPVLDVQWGNVWTNIDRTLFESMGVELGQRLAVTIAHAGKIAWRGVAPYVGTFGDVATGAPLVYVNSLDEMAIALNQDDFARQHGIESGNDWSVRIERASR